MAGRRTDIIRIIGGNWRSRRLPVLADSGVRPTSDRTRETLFNWLQAHVAGSRCLDLFAGSGALGFEALSRGADLVTFVDQDLRVIQQLQKNAEVLKTERADIRWQQADEFLLGPIPDARPYDVVFLDPPFREDLLGISQKWLVERHWLSDTAFIYMESERRRPLPDPLSGWQVHHDKRAGQVAYRLLQRQE